jgi:alkaline phosphatase
MIRAMLLVAFIAGCVDAGGAPEHTESDDERPARAVCDDLSGGISMFGVHSRAIEFYRDGRGEDGAGIAAAKLEDLATREYCPQFRDGFEAVVRSSPEQPTPPPTMGSDGNGITATLVAAGDIAACDEDGDSATAALVAQLDGIVATLGDNVYPAGSADTYKQCYNPVWGRFLNRTRPALGNHDVKEDGGAAYFDYFGDAAGTPGEGWYSYELGAWHVVVLNSNCGLFGCAGSAQVGWLVQDLAASDALCTLAYWHHPRFSSGRHGGTPDVAPFWEALEQAGAEVVLAGHDHMYERFAPQTAAGVASPDGLRQFTVGTGGKQLHEAERVASHSEVRIDDAHGVLQMTLRSESYAWSFLKSDGTEVDSGSASCH